MSESTEDTVTLTEEEQQALSGKKRRTRLQSFIDLLAEMERGTWAVYARNVSRPNLAYYRSAHPDVEWGAIQPKGAKGRTVIARIPQEGEAPESPSFSAAPPRALTDRELASMDVQLFDRADLPEGGPRRFSLLGAFEQVLHEHPGVWFRYPKVGAARLARSRERRCPDTEWRYSAAGPGQFHLYARSVRES